MLSQQKFLLSYVSMELGTGTHIIMVIEQIVNRIYFHLKTKGMKHAIQTKLM